MSKWARLLINPFAVTSVAREASLLAAMIWGATAYATLLWTLLIVIVWGVGEPYPTFEAYLWSVPPEKAAILWGILFVLILLSFTAGALVLPRTLESIESRSSLLCAVPWIGPGLVLGALAVIGGATHPSMGINAGVPAWTDWFPFKWAASCATPLVVVALIYATWAGAMRQLGRDARAVCVACGYPRAGLTAAETCPECGAAIPYLSGSGEKSTSPQ